MTTKTKKKKTTTKSLTEQTKKFAERYKNTPFFGFYPAEDICKCTNGSCAMRMNCFRFMGGNTEWQSISKFHNKKEEGCEHYLPYYVWRSGNGKNLMLYQIDDDYLKNIIIHLLERALDIEQEIEKRPEEKEVFSLFVKNSILVAREFIKEARKRKIYK